MSSIVNIATLKKSKTLSPVLEYFNPIDSLLTNLCFVIPLSPFYHRAVSDTFLEILFTVINKIQFTTELKKVTAEAKLI